MTSIDRGNLPGREGSKTGLGKGAHGPEWLTLKMGGSKVKEMVKGEALRIACSKEKMV